MMKSLWKRLFALLLAASAISRAQVPDLTAGGTLTNTRYTTLGPTGLQGWAYTKGNGYDGSAKIRVLIKAEDRFNPHEDVAFGSLRFGASTKVDFGGDCKPVASAKRGKDLEIAFDAANHGFTDDNFAGKLLGKDANGDLLIGYSRLLWVDYSPYAIGNSGEGKTKP